MAEIISFHKDRANLDYNRQPAPSEYLLDIEAAGQVWNTQFRTAEDLFSINVPISPDKSIKIHSHMVAQSEETLRYIAYVSGLHDAQNVDEAFQDDLARYVEPGEIAIAIKHQCPAPAKDVFDFLRLQCHHVQVVVGVEVEGQRGAIALHQPRVYFRSTDTSCKYEKQFRLMGNPNYPMILLKPTFPEVLSIAEKQSFVDNIRTWMLIANTYLEFPHRDVYLGKDPIATDSVEHVEILGRKLLDAMCGDQEARAWLADPENRTYCSEFVHAGLNLGIHCPLNKAYLGEERYSRIEPYLQNRTFLEENENNFALHASVCLAPESLKPITQYSIDMTESRNCTQVGVDPRLALRLYTWADILQICVDEFLDHTPYEMPARNFLSIAIAKAKREFLNLYFLQHPSMKGAPERRKFDDIYDQMISLPIEIADREEFLLKLSELTCEFANLAFDISPAVDYIISPNCYLISATRQLKEKEAGGVLGWQYIGHCIHEKLLTPIAL